PPKATTSAKTEEITRNKRDAIIAAAREIFSRQGYEATTIAEIAHAADVAVGTVYLYFHNKREIYVATSANWVDEIAAVLLQPDLLNSPVEQMPRAIIEKVFQTCHLNNKFMSLFQVDLQTPDEIQVHRKGEARLVKAINAFLNSCVERGDFPPFDTEMYAKIFYSLVHSVIYDCFCIENGNNMLRYQEQTIEILERILFGPSLRG
ncbi:MAG TPA: TetR/AcrR family transcriptional regulator, partial [Ktedonobacteraceae bacterium]|nr:TetR/AcrR family transcriptional regulator [Ktedonobacteraceae bacterium]